MKQFKPKIVTTALVIFAFIFISTGLRNDVHAQRTTARVSDRQVEKIIGNIERRSDAFRRSFDNALDRSQLNGTYTEDRVNEFVRAFEESSNKLRSRFNGRAVASGDVENVLISASVIDQFMATNLRQTRVQGDWTLLKRDLQNLANVYGIAFNLNGRVLPPTVVANQRPYRVGDSEVEAVLRRVEMNSDAFRRALDRALDRSKLNSTNREDNLTGYVTNFENATDALRRNFDGRASLMADVSNVLVQAARIDDFMKRNLRRDALVQREWKSVRIDLNLLASYYSLSFNLDNRRGMPPYAAFIANTTFTGTYRLDTYRSDNARTVAENATRLANPNNRQRVSDNIVRRLQSPEMLAVERRGMQVLLASSLSPQISLVADGLEHLESYPNGRTSRVRATLAGNSLTIVSNGDRPNDFSVVFTALDSGRRLMVTRSIYLEGLNKAVEARSYYDRTSGVAQFDIFKNRPSDSANSYLPQNFILPPNTVLRAVTNTRLSTKTAHDGDRFSMTVRSPGPYAGAVIEGFISSTTRSGRVSGRSAINLHYETIRMPDNKTYRFAGITESIRAASGETVRIDNEGTLRESDSQTARTVGRTAIGTGVGALLGALLGGGEGAAIGAALGAGTGIGSIYVQGRDDLEVPRGSEFTIRSFGPGRA